MKDNLNSSGYNFDFDWIKFLPIMVLVGIVPLITTLVMVDADPALANTLGSGELPDFFSQGKSTAILGITAIIVIMCFFIFDKKLLKNDIWTKVSIVGSLIYLVATILSTFLSDYRDIALWGVPDRAEGGLILISYVIIFLYTLYITKSGEQAKFIIFPLALCTIIIGILGVYQYIGEDLLLQTEWGLNLIVPDKYAHLKPYIEPLYEKGNMYGTLYHYNYVGSFAAITVPLFLILCLFTKANTKRDIALKVFYGVMTLFSIWLLFGSTARSGLIGVACSIVSLLIIFARQFISKWKITLPIIISVIVCVVALNFTTNGDLFRRVPDLVDDMLAIFLPASSNINYKDNIPVRNMFIEDNKFIVEMQEGTIIASFENDELVVVDETGTPISMEDNSVTDSRFTGTTISTSLSSFTISIRTGGYTAGRVKLDNDEMYFIHLSTGDRMTVEDAAYIGFEGKETLGSARGYIWSRSLPMMKETFFIGNGPDTYVMEFPQGDRLAKWNAYGTPDMLVDKPHNWYLQIAINQSGLALLGFIILMASYIINSLRLYTCKQDYTNSAIIGSACCCSVIGFLGAGIFNDSVVSVSPIFWTILGFGIAVNYTQNIDNRTFYKMATLMS